MKTLKDIEDEIIAVATDEHSPDGFPLLKFNGSFCYAVASRVYIKIDHLRAVAKEWITQLQKEHKKHLKEEGGSCYCMASVDSCKPEVWKWIEHFFNLEDDGKNL